MQYFKLSRKQVDVVAQHLYKCLDSEPLFEVGPFFGLVIIP